MTTTVDAGSAAAATDRGPDEIVAVRAVAKSYGEVVALAGVDLTMRRGLVYGLLGPNGAGKTTLIRAMLGLVEVDGEIEVLGHAPGAPAALRRVGRRALGHRPRHEHAVDLQPDVEVQARRVVALDDEAVRHGIHGAGTTN